MDGDQRPDALRRREHPAARRLDGHASAEQRRRGGGAEADHERGSDQLDLPPQPRPARVDLALPGLVVDAALALALALPLEVLHRVRDVERPAVEPRPRERLVEQAARGTDERMTGQVLLVPGLLADQDDPRGRIALAEDRLRGAPVEVAAGARGRLALQVLQSASPVRELRRLHGPRSCCSKTWQQDLCQLGVSRMIALCAKEGRTQR
jgi:hypothetical protein